MWEYEEYTEGSYGLYRFLHSGSAHCIIFNLLSPIRALERSVRPRPVCAGSGKKLKAVRHAVDGFVVVLEHVHLLISEPERGTITNATHSLKICSARGSVEVLQQSHVCRLQANAGYPLSCLFCCADHRGSGVKAPPPICLRWLRVRNWRTLRLIDHAKARLAYAGTPIPTSNGVHS